MRLAVGVLELLGSGQVDLYVSHLRRNGKSSRCLSPGYLAFPVFALECFAMYVTGAWVFSRKYIAEKKYQE